MVKYELNGKRRKANDTWDTHNMGIQEKMRRQRKDKRREARERLRA